MTTTFYAHEAIISPRCGDTCPRRSAHQPRSLASRYDVVIANGKIVDGTGNAWFYGDVGIVGDRIGRVVGKVTQGVTTEILEPSFRVLSGLFHVASAFK